MENKQRRGKKGEGVKGEGRLEKRAGPNIFQTNNAGQKREQEQSRAQKFLEEVQRLGFRLWRLCQWEDQSRSS